MEIPLFNIFSLFPFLTLNLIVADSASAITNIGMTIWGQDPNRLLTDFLYATAVSEGGSCPQVDSAFRFRDNSVKIIQAPVLILIKKQFPSSNGEGNSLVWRDA